MAYTVGDGAILEFTVRGLLFGETSLSIFHYRLDLNLPPEDGVQLINNFDAALNDVGGFIQTFYNCCTTEWRVPQLVYQWIYPTRYARYIISPDGGSGNVPEPTMPSNMAVAITKRTETAGRRGVGTLHMPGVPSEWVTENRIVQEGTIAYGALANRIAAVVNLGLNTDMTPIIYRRSAPAQSPVITSADPIPEPRTMRRRGVRLGI